MDALSGREMAGLWWTAFAVLTVTYLAIRQTAVRQSLAQVVVTAAAPKVLGPMLLVGAWLAGAVAAASVVGLWATDLIVPTAMWFACGALPLTMRAMLDLEQPGRMRELAAEGVGVSALIAAVVELQSFDVWTEAFVLQPALFAAILIVSLGGHRASRRAETFLAMVGFLLAILALVGLPYGEPAAAWIAVGQAALLCVWLTLVLLPLLFLLRVIAAYEVAIMRLTWKVSRPLASWKLSLAIAGTAGLRPERVLAVGKESAGGAAGAARTVQEARQAIRGWRQPARLPQDH